MKENVFGDLPAEIRQQIETLVSGEGTGGLANRESYAVVWKRKYDLFVSQISVLGMEFVENMKADDARGAILLTYSGSLVSLDPADRGTRKMEYASIKFRSDVPESARAPKAKINESLRVNASAEFTDSPLKQSSSLYKIAVCPEGTDASDQIARIREAMIYLTNGFVKINRTLAENASVTEDQFNFKAIVASIARRHDMTQVAVRALLEDYQSIMEAGVLLGERVHFGKIGTMNLKTKAAQKARVMKNLHTGEDILVPAKPESLVPKFSFSRVMKEKCLKVDPDLVNDASEGDEGEE